MGPSTAPGLPPSGAELEAGEVPGLDEETEPPTPVVDASGTYATRYESLPSPPTPDLDPGQGMAPEGYEILEELGRGGMGVVYRARQVGLNRQVALKMILGDANVRPGQLERFRVEAEAVARLRHPNVVQIYEVGEWDDRPYCSLELLEGGSLAARMAGVPGSPRPSAETLAVLARAMHAAHRAGIVHRDLKPQNVLYDLDGTPKVTDFGLAKRLDVEDGLTMTYEVMGTPVYMAPEQAMGKNREVGPAADVYALGAILYAMLTGRPPLQGTTWRETLMMVVDQDPPAPSRLQPRIPRDLETICLKCLAKDPRKRYASAEALADDLARFLASRPILARRTPVWERGLKWTRRHPTAAVVGTIVFASTIGLAVGVRQANESARLRGLDDERRVSAMDRVARDEIAEGRASMARGGLEDARVIFERILTRVQPEPRLQEVTSLASALRDEVDRRREDRDRRDADRARFARFVTLFDDALFQDARAGGLDPVSSVDLTRESSRAALKVFGAEGDPPRPDALTDSEWDQVTSGRYALRLILAGAIARPRSGEDPRHQAAEALAILDRAAATRPPTRAYRLRRADCLEQAGDLDGARHERAEAARLEPSGAFEHFLLGQERQRAGDFAAAQRHLNAALQERPDLFWAECLSAIGSLNARPSRPAEAKAALTACLIQRPAYAWLHILRGTALGQLGAMALDAARLVPPSLAGDLRAEAEAHFDSAEFDFRESLKKGLDARLRYALHMNRGVLRFQRGRIAEAVEDFGQAVAIEPGRYEALVSLAKALARQGKHAEAIARLDQAIGLKPDLAALHRDRALLRLGAGDPTPGHVAQVLDDLNRAIRLEPPGSRAAAEDHARRARLLLRLDRAEEALAAADSALAIAPDLPEAHRDRAAALLDLKRFDQVIGACDAALARGPASPELHELRGLARVGRGDFAGAVADYTQALGLRPAWTRVLVYRGLAYLTANAPELALVDFESVLRLDPANPDGYAGRAAARVRLRRHKDAVADAEQALARGTPTPSRLYSAARTYAQALAVALGEIPQRGRPALRDAAAYETRALALLAQAVEKTPPEGRERFWKEIFEPDTAMAPLRRRNRPGSPIRTSANPSR